MRPGATRLKITRTPPGSRLARLGKPATGEHHAPGDAAADAAAARTHAGSPGHVHRPRDGRQRPHGRERRGHHGRATERSAGPGRHVPVRCRRPPRDGTRRRDVPGAVPERRERDGAVRDRGPPSRVRVLGRGVARHRGQPRRPRRSSGSGPTASAGSRASPRGSAAHRTPASPSGRSSSTRPRRSRRSPRAKAGEGGALIIARSLPTASIGCGRDLVPAGHRLRASPAGRRRAARTTCTRSSASPGWTRATRTCRACGAAAGCAVSSPPTRTTSTTSSAASARCSTRAGRARPAPPRPRSAPVTQTVDGKTVTGTVPNGRGGYFVSAWDPRDPRAAARGVRHDRQQLDGQSGRDAAACWRSCSGSATTAASSSSPRSTRSAWIPAR